MTRFKGRGTTAGILFSALVVVALLGLAHVGLVVGFIQFILPEARVPFVFLVILSFGFVTTLRLASAVRLVQARRRRWVGVDDDGVEWTDGVRMIRMAWAEIEEVRVHFVRIEAHVASYVTVQTVKGEQVALSHHFQGRIQEKRGGVLTENAVLDVEMTPFLLWMLKERAGLSEVEPFVWRRGEPAVVVVDDPTADPNLHTRVGVPLANLLSPLQILIVVGTVFLYALLSNWNWLVAILLVALLFFHELGHVYAMVRLGMKVRGVYFVPFFGAVTVPETLWKDRDALAYTSLSGPLWGVLASVPILAVYYLTGQQHWDLLAVVLVNALLNLLNLLPIPPLDGARVLASILSSFSPKLGLAVGVSVILVTLAGAAFADVMPLWGLLILALVFGVFGGLEVISQYSAALEAEKIRRLVQPKAGWTEDVARLGDMLALQPCEEYAWIRAGGAPRRVGRWTRWQQVLGCTAMGGRRIAVYLIFYLFLVGLLVAGLVAAAPLLDPTGR